MRLAHLLDKNAPLRNRHRGQRCFILGNGPSLARHDLARLRGEVTIVVNQFQKHQQLTEMRPPYWVIADPLFWERPEDHLFPILQRLVEAGLHTRLFCPVGGVGTMANAPTGPLVEPHFFVYGDGHPGEAPIDFCGPIPHWGQNVISPAMMLALHLGCDPIYLIGCDHDFLAFTKDDYEGKTFGHGFGGNSDHHSSPASERFDWDTWSHAMKRTLWEYERLRDYAAGWGRRIYNATDGGQLEVFPRVDFERALAIPQGRGTSSTAHTLARVAVAHLNRDDPTTAEELLDQAARLNVDATARVDGIDALRAVCAARRGDRPRALAHAHQALCDRRDPAGLAQALLQSLST